MDRSVDADFHICPAVFFTYQAEAKVMKNYLFRLIELFLSRDGKTTNVTGAFICLGHDPASGENQAGRSTLSTHNRILPAAGLAIPKSTGGAYLPKERLLVRLMVDPPLAEFSPQKKSIHPSSHDHLIIFTGNPVQNTRIIQIFGNPLTFKGRRNSSGPFQRISLLRKRKHI